MFLSRGVHDQNKNKTTLPATRFSREDSQEVKAKFKAVPMSGGDAKSNRDLDDGCLATVEEDKKSREETEDCFKLIFRARL